MFLIFYIENIINLKVNMKKAFVYLKIFFQSVYMYRKIRGLGSPT